MTKTRHMPTVEQKLSPYHELSWYELFIIFISITSLISMAFLAFETFKPQYVIPSAFLFTVALKQVLKLKFPTKFQKPEKTFWVICLVAVSFRFERWPNLSGGQDQGLYTNMASAISRSGSVTFTDSFRAQLSPDLQNVYDQAALLSVHLVDSAKSLFTIEFYPLHPIWLSIGDFFSSAYGHHMVLIFFSIIGLAGGYQLALEIDGRIAVARLFLALLALNPALIFFTKFPVSEITAFAFAVNGFLFLTRYLKSRNEYSSRLYFLLTLMCFGALTATRWQLFLYLPFLGILGVCSLFPTLNKNLRRKLVTITFSVFIVLVISMAYYRWKQPTLFTPMWDTITEAIPSTTLLVILGIVGFSLILATRKYLSNAQHSKSLQLAELINKAAPWLLILAFAFSIFTIMEIYDQSLMAPWNYATPAEDMSLFRFHNLYRLILFASPVAIGLILLSPLILRNRSTPISLLFLFGGSLWIVILSRPFIPYLYYYGRYLVVDMLPLTLLIVSILCIDLKRSFGNWGKYLSRASIALLVIYSFFFSYLQIGNFEGEPVDIYEDFLSDISKQDVMVVSLLDQRVVVPLRITYEQSVFVLGDPLSSLDVLDELKEIAQRRGGRLILAAPSGIGAPEAEPFKTIEVKDCFMTNSDHFRGGLHLGPQISKRRFFLPTKWTCVDNPYEFFDITDLMSS